MTPLGVLEACDTDTVIAITTSFRPQQIQIIKEGHNKELTWAKVKCKVIALHPTVNPTRKLEALILELVQWEILLK